MNHQRMLTVIYSALPRRCGELTMIRKRCLSFSFVSFEFAAHYTESNDLSPFSLSLSLTRLVFQISAAPP